MYQTYSASDEDLVKSVAGSRSPGKTGWIRVNCPICPSRRGTPDKRESFGLNVETGFWHCFRCGAKGRLRDKKYDRDWKPRGYLVNSAALRDLEPIALPNEYKPLWEPPGDTAIVFREARKYLDSRGVSKKVQREACIGACFTGLCRGRVVFPVLDVSRTITLGWSARPWVEKVAPGVRKYLSASGMDRGRLLYNEAALHDRRVPYVLLVEGVFDAVRCWPHGVASLGKPTEAHIQKLLKIKKPIVVGLDGDAWLEGEMLTYRLQLDGAQAFFLKFPPGKDPGSMPVDWIKKMSKNLIFG